MDKQEYEAKKQDIIKTYGKPTYDEMAYPRQPLNDSAKMLAKLKIERLTDAKARNDKVKLETNLERSVKYTKSVPLGLTELDLQPFSSDEQEVLIEYFANTNLTSRELHKTCKLSIRKIEALFRSGPFVQLAMRVFGAVGQPRTMWAILKLIEEKNPKIVELMAKHFGVMKDDSLNLNINKPLELSPEFTAKLKELGDSISNQNH